MRDCRRLVPKEPKPKQALKRRVREPVEVRGGSWNGWVKTVSLPSLERVRISEVGEVRIRQFPQLEE